MELLEFLKQIPFPVLFLVVAVFVVVTLVMAFQYFKQKGLEGIRTDVYQLILAAEHMYNESGHGKQKLKWVVSQARLLLPKWMQVFVTEEFMEKLIDKWFLSIKDLLDDGKLYNKEQEG